MSFSIFTGATELPLRDVSGVIQGCDVVLYFYWIGVGGAGHAGRRGEASAAPPSAVRKHQGRGAGPCVCAAAPPPLLLFETVNRWLGLSFPIDAYSLTRHHPIDAYSLTRHHPIDAYSLTRHHPIDVYSLTRHHPIDVYSLTRHRPASSLETLPPRNVPPSRRAHAHAHLSMRRRWQQPVLETVHHAAGGRLAALQRALLVTRCRGAQRRKAPRRARVGRRLRRPLGGAPGGAPLGCSTPHVATAAAAASAAAAAAPAAAAAAAAAPAPAAAAAAPALLGHVFLGHHTGTRLAEPARRRAPAPQAQAAPAPPPAAGAPPRSRSSGAKRGAASLGSRNDSSSDADVESDVDAAAAADAGVGDEAGAAPGSEACPPSKLPPGAPDSAAAAAAPSLSRTADGTWLFTSFSRRSSPPGCCHTASAATPSPLVPRLPPAPSPPAAGTDNVSVSL
eukprot:349613-Chlamydomonas_euryale.AAC.1